MSKREVVERLKGVPLFGGCSSRQLRYIAGRGWEQEYPLGSDLCEQGKFGDDFFVILDGQAEVTRDRRKVGVLGPGTYFGEVALLRPSIGRTPRTATVTAVTLVRCFLLSKNEFRTLIYEGNIAVNLLFGYARYLLEPF